MSRLVFALLLGSAGLWACSDEGPAAKASDSDSGASVDAAGDVASSDAAADSAASCDGIDIGAAPDTCNGSRALCGRRVDQVAFATAHNAMSNVDDGWLSPNQDHGIARQLRDGVRGLMLDTHYDDNGQPSLCHGNCRFGSLPLVAGLATIAEFLRCNPRELVAIIFEAYVSPADTAAAFAESGLDNFAHAQNRTSNWPSLGELLAQRRQLLVFSDDPEPGAPPYYQYVWDHGWETPFSFQSAANFSCDKNRGSADNSLFILNHFLTNPVADRSLAEQVNHNPLFIDRARQCQSESGKLPNFVTVDFYAVGDLLEVVDELNAL